MTVSTITAELLHIAIIMDGNGRWAKMHRKPRLMGHQAGTLALKKIIEYIVAEKKLKALTVFALSCENIARPKYEINGLTHLMQNSLLEYIADLHRSGVKIMFIGDFTVLPAKLRQQMTEASELTKDNTQLILTVAINYSGQWHIANEMSSLLNNQDFLSKRDHFDTQICQQYLGRALRLTDYPVDLLIRTSGEQRLSNFLLWQLAYAEFYFSSCLWPDFDALELKKAMSAFAERKRRFGLLAEQDC